MAGFCSHCGQGMALAMVAGRHREQCSACGFVRWKNPVPVGLALIEHDGKLVLIRRGIAPLAGYWAPPTGYVECGESVPEAVVREAREECGLVVEPKELVGVFSQADVDVVIVAYRTVSVGGELCAGDDAADAMLVEPGRLPAQTGPNNGSPLEHWFFNVIHSLTADWR